MIEIIRNLIAFFSIFIVITSGTMIFLHACISLYEHNKTLSRNQECIIFITGIALATVLIPFYNLPC